MKPRNWFNIHRLKKFGLALAGLFVFLATVSIVLAVSFSRSHRNEPYRIGFSFSAKYARELGVDPDETLRAALEDLSPSQVRLMSYWDDIEISPGEYDFDWLDRQIAAVGKAGSRVSLAIGLRQPRWPECHYPQWAKNLSLEDQHRSIYRFVDKVVRRYKDNPAILDWQLENEAQAHYFGICSDYSNERLAKEYALVKQIDPTRPVVVSVSDGWGLPIRGQLGDSIGFSVYTVVYNNFLYKGYFHHIKPAWFWTLRAALVERLLRRPVFIHELQAEPWGDRSTALLSLEEQSRTMDAARVERAVGYAKRTGIRRMDLWGVEWWYWRKVKFGDPSLWQAAIRALQ